MDIDGSDEYVEFPDFEEWLGLRYGMPKQGTAEYNVLKRFGHRVYLDRAYPEIFCQTGVSKRDIWGWQHHLYRWYCVRLMTGDDDEVDEDALLALLETAPVYYVLNDISVPGVTNIAVNTKCVPVWWDGGRAVVLFCIGDDLVLAEVPQADLKETDSTFRSWEDIE